MSETTAEDAELRELFAALSDASAAAAEALNNADVAPIGFALERFYDLDRHVASIIKRIRAILLGPTETRSHAAALDFCVFMGPPSRRAECAQGAGAEVGAVLER